jgi:3-oxoacyl-[acyl-carrier-protein] synthase-3
MYRHVLLVGVDLLSRYLDWTDRNTCVLFGDGAGAVLLSASDGPGGLLGVELYSDGSGEQGIIIPGGGTAHPATDETVRDRLHFMRMAGKEVYRYATRQLADTTQAAVQAAGLRMADVDLFLYHQANLRILETVRDLLGIPSDKVYVNLDRYGNTSAASVPMALAEAVASGRVQVGDRLLMGAFGAGYTAGAAVVEWTADPSRAFLAPGEQTRAGQPRREPVAAGVD